ncbi:T-cell surface glycoprotein CD5-like [Latimeria chalumnae]|uniref:T-cell surface glycoprotein CD5-like n=1 Tax=Latimeria chalumnae TaxID=7897 RepID=UPI00313C049D
MKKYRKKKERQWIGPTRVNQNVSFHRNNNLNPSPRYSSNLSDNEYSSPPKPSQHASAYPALERLANASSLRPESVSDLSDYELSEARRL